MRFLLQEDGILKKNKKTAQRNLHHCNKCHVCSDSVHFCYLRGVTEKGYVSDIVALREKRGFQKTGWKNEALQSAVFKFRDTVFSNHYYSILIMF